MFRNNIHFICKLFYVTVSYFFIFVIINLLYVCCSWLHIQILIYSNQSVYKVNDSIFDVMIILLKNVGNSSIDFT